jgi:hypothetical protein
MSQRVYALSFVTPVQGVEAGLANGTGRCPLVENIRYSVLSFEIPRISQNSYDETAEYCLSC